MKQKKLQPNRRNTALLTQALYLLCLSILFTFAWGTNEAQAQIFEPEGLNMPGTWDSFDNPPQNDVLRSFTINDGEVQKITEGTTRWQTNFSVDAAEADLAGGTYTWIFTSGPDDNRYANKWANVTVSMNTLQTYTHQGETDNTITLSDGNYYVMNWQDQGYQSTSAIFMEFSEEPAEINSVSQSPAAGEVEPTDAVDVTVELNKLPGTGENVYLWYQVGGTSSLSAITFADNGGTISGTAQIPAQDANTNVSYRVISSSITLDDNETDDYYWMRTARFSDESSYQVSPEVPGAITLSSPADNFQAEATSVEFSWEADDAAVEYQIEVNSESDFSGESIASATVEGTSTSVRVPFNEELFWRVRGVNGEETAGDWSATRSFTTLEVDYVANGNDGFGGAIGGSGMVWELDGSTVNVTFYKGSGDLSDEFVLYLSTGEAGRNVIDDQVNDGQDDLRRAISNAGDNASTLTFYEGFEATHAIGINDGFSGLWEIPAEGQINNDGLIFRYGVNSDFEPGDASFTFSFDLNTMFADGRAVSEIQFIETYLNGENGFTSDEFYGANFEADADGNPGGEDITFTKLLPEPQAPFTAPVFTETLNSGAGWYMLSPLTPSNVNNLAAQDLVQGIPGGAYAEFEPNVFANYSGADVTSPGDPDDPENPRLVNGWAVPDNITQTAIAGQGFLWYLFDAPRDDVPEAGALPLDLRQVGEAFSNTQFYPLHANGDKFNMFGNPFDAVLPVGNLVAQNGSIQNTLRTYNPTDGWQIVTELQPMQGGMIENDDADGLAIADPSIPSPLSAPEVRSLALRLSAESPGNDGENKIISDNSIMLSFHENAGFGWDRWDASKLMPLRNAYAQAAFPGERDAEPVMKARTSLPYELNDEILTLPLHIDAAGVAEEMTFSVSQFEGFPDDWTLQLHDMVTGEVTALHEGATYNFTHEVAEVDKSDLLSIAELAAIRQMPAKNMDAEARFELIIMPAQPTS
ncbi:MAG: hypothetical protein ACOC2C_04800, partial [Cyclonatronaceae bacterium]